MAKNILQDIVPPEKRSIRNIPLPNRSTKREPVIEKTAQKPISSPTPINPVLSETPHPKVYSYEENKFPTSFSTKSKKGVWVAVIGAVLIVAFAVASLFTSAIITITPITQAASVSNDAVFVAKRSAAAEELSFEVITITKSAGKEVPASGEEKVERKASGNIIVYNNIDTLPQRLIKNTRFETPAGLVYRINESVVVPGKKSENGQSVPGSVEVVVYADEVGEKYNIGKTDFTVPGFKNDQVRFKGIYARSKTEMTGGFVGTIKKVSEADQKNAIQALQTELSDDLKAEALTQVPEGFLLFDGAETIQYSSLPQSNDAGSSVTINEQGIFRGFLFSQKNFSQYIASKLAPELVKNNVLISNPKLFVFTLKDSESLNGEMPDSISFNLSGSLSFISQFDETVIKSDLAGKPEKSLSSVMANYSGVKSATSVNRPFWKGSFPEDTKNISIKVETK